MRYEKKDWFGEFIKLRHELIGDPRFIYFGKINTENQQTTWYTMDHAKHDGIGAFIKLLRDIGHNINQIPTSHLSEPPLNKRLNAWLNASKESKSKPAKWKIKHQKTVHNLTQPELFWKVFTVKQSKKIARHALKQKASVNSLLLASLSNVIADNFLCEGENFSWTVPTNLRGALKLPNDTANHCSALTVNVKYHTTPAEVHAQIKRALKQGFDWSFYWTIKFLCRYTPKLIQKIIYKSYDKNSSSIGSFTNLGPWFSSLSDKTSDPNEAWVIVPLYNPNYPIAAGSITWNGQLSIALSIHPAINLNHAETQSILDEWYQMIIDDKLS